MKTMKGYIMAAALLCLCLVAPAQDESTVAGFRKTSKQEQMQASLNYGLAPQIMNIKARSITCLDGAWKAIVDQYENGFVNYRLLQKEDAGTFFADKSYYDDPTTLIEYDFATDGNLFVPGDWNTQRPELYYYEGTVWYRQIFEAHPQASKRYFLYFGAANYEAIVGVNGVVSAKHTGGYTPFNLEVTDLLKDGLNTLVVKVDNKRRAEGVPTVNSDWWNYGGITRSVYLVETPQAFVREYSIRLKDQKNICGWVKVDGASSASTVEISIPELKLKKTLVTDSEGYASFEVKAKPKLWHPSDPKLYDVNIALGGDVVADRIGFRTIETKGNKILLNGKQVYLRGTCVHEERPYGKNGRVCTPEQDRILLGWAKEMNCNFLRLAHYPHNEEMVRLAEEMGLMVWDEIPCYWTIHWDDPQTYANAENQLQEVITRDRNRANVIIWSVANETPRSESRLRFLSSLIAKVREMDGTRLVSAAMEKEYLDAARTHATVNDELAFVADVMSFNQYVGWYDGAVDKCSKVNWTFEIQKPVIITEFGAGALYGYHADKSIRFSEEYQEYLFQENIKMFERIPGLSGTTPWILMDFRSPRRQLKNIQDDFNRKGLISNQGQKKKAFYVMQDWYARLAEKFED